MSPDVIDRTAGLVAPAAQQAGERLGRTLGDADERFGEEDDRRVLGDQAAELDDATCPGRQGGDAMVATPAEPDEVDHLVDAARTVPSPK